MLDAPNIYLASVSIEFDIKKLFYFVFYCCKTNSITRDLKSLKPNIIVWCKIKKPLFQRNIINLFNYQKFKYILGK